MTDIPRLVFGWVGTQSPLTAAAVLGAGLLSGFYGFRMARLLIAAGTAVLACVAASWLPDSLAVPREAAMVIAAVGGVAIGASFRRASVVLLSAATFGAVGLYISALTGLRGWPALIPAALFGSAAAVLAMVSTGPMTMLYTTVQGALLIVGGAAGLAGAYLKPVAETFQKWVNSGSLIVPILLVMVTVMAYSVQATKRQGDLVTGR